MRHPAAITLGQSGFMPPAGGEVMPDQSQQAIRGSWILRKLRHSGKAHHQRSAAGQQLHLQCIEISAAANDVNTLGEIRLFERRVDADEVAPQPRVEIVDGIAHQR